MAQTPTNIDVSIRFERIYVREANLRIVDPPLIFDLKWRPEMQVKIEPRSYNLGNQRHEVVIEIELKASISGKEVLEIKVQQGALVHIADTLPEARAEVLRVICPNLLFPYLREVVDNLAVKASLPPIGLTPIDFGNLPASGKVKQEKTAYEMPSLRKSSDDGVLN